MIGAHGVGLRLLAKSLVCGVMMRGDQNVILIEADHPHCIFCGGETRATTKDHVPSRQMFHKKDWPVGYEFPACRSCNETTSGDEQVVALMARMYPSGVTKDHDQELEGLFKAVRNNRPQVLVEWRPSRRQVRQANAAPWAANY